MYKVTLLSLLNVYKIASDNPIPSYTIPKVDFDACDSDPFNQTARYALVGSDSLLEQHQWEVVYLNRIVTFTERHTCFITLTTNYWDVTVLEYFSCITSSW